MNINNSYIIKSSGSKSKKYPRSSPKSQVNLRHSLFISMKREQKFHFRPGGLKYLFSLQGMTKRYYMPRSYERWHEGDIGWGYEVKPSPEAELVSYSLLSSEKCIKKSIFWDTYAFKINLIFYWLLLTKSFSL